MGKTKRVILCPCCGIFMANYIVIQYTHGAAPGLTVLVNEKDRVLCWNPNGTTMW